MIKEKVDSNYKKGFNLAYLLINEGKQDQYNEILENFKALKELTLNQLYLGLEAGKRQALNEKSENVEINKFGKSGELLSENLYDRGDKYRKNLNGDKESFNKQPLQETNLEEGLLPKRDSEIENKADGKAVPKAHQPKGEVLPPFPESNSLKDEDNESIKRVGKNNRSL